MDEEEHDGVSGVILPQDQGKFDATCDALLHRAEALWIQSVANVVGGPNANPLIVDDHDNYTEGSKEEEHYNL